MSATPPPHSVPPRTRSVVLVTATETEPRRFGKQVVLGGILDHLVKRLGADRVHVVLVGAPELDRPPVPYHRWVLPRPPALRQGLSVLRRTVFPGLGDGARSSLQESVLYDPALAGRLTETLRRIAADLQVWDTVRLGQYVGPAAEAVPRRVLYADDLFSLRYEAMLREPDHGDAGGQFAALLPTPARRLLASRRAQRLLLSVERGLVARSEVRQPAWFDATLLVSEDEAATLRHRLAGQPAARTVHHLPPLLGPGRPALRLVHPGGRPEFTFVGGFGYAPNRQGLDWFLRACREAVLRRIPDVLINVVGPGTEVGLESAVPWGDAVRFLGWVDDLDGVLSQSLALLSPLRSGSGIKIKALEALSRGLPVVATPAGVQGLVRPAEPGGTGFLVGEDPDALAEAMTAMTDPRTRGAVADAARSTWDEHYAPDAVAPVYDQLFALPTGDQQDAPAA